MARICLLTPYPLQPLHPRTEMIRDILGGAGHDVALVAVTRNRADELISRLTFKVFNPLGTLRKLRAALDCDLLYVQDLSLLLAAPVARALRRPVIYETLDHCVDLRLHAQPLLARAGVDELIKPLGCAAERALARYFTDGVIVNSDSLHEYFGPASHRLFYASPLEALGTENRAGLPPALLYLGLFSRDKGAHDALDLRERLALPLFVFGSVPDADVRERLERSRDVMLVARLSSSELKRELASLLARHFLLGLSMIHAAHYSYEVQEANKDIDYMALGVPILGNHRKPTADKVEAGCGVFADDAESIARMVRDTALQARTAERCRAYYAQRYARATFARGLLEAVDEALRSANCATLPPPP